MPFSSNCVREFMLNRRYNHLSVKIDSNQDVGIENNNNNFRDLLFRRLLPIRIDCERGAFIFGNPETPSILVAEFSQASGTYEASKVIVIKKKEGQNFFFFCNG